MTNGLSQSRSAAFVGGSDVLPPGQSNALREPPVRRWKTAGWCSSPSTGAPSLVTVTCCTGDAWLKWTPFLMSSSVQYLSLVIELGCSPPVTASNFQEMPLSAAACERSAG